MPICPQCGSENPAGIKLCGSCGLSLDQAGHKSFATVRWKGQLPQERGLHRSLSLETLFSNKKKMILGRGADCDVYLAHPTVSRHHAVMERLADGIRVEDLGSINGVQIDGQRMLQSALVKDEQRISIGPFLFRFSGGFLHILDSSQSLRLEARRLDKVVAGNRKILDTVNLVVEPGEFLCLLGPSGSGKSTLMDCLSGRRPATGGAVLANGENFYLHFNSFRQSLGYVPQRDIVHTQLTVQRALYYTARLRLPPDTHASELDNRVREVLERMELNPHKDTLVGNLSGGQIKRVSLGAELLARPCLLFIDEATSGLDAGTETRMMGLFRQLADEGKSIICITHHVDNVDLCHLILVLARGKLVYYGPPSEARTYFGVSRISEVYDCLAKKEAEAWEKQFLGCSLHQEFVEKRLAAGDSASTSMRDAKEKTKQSSSSLVLSLPPAKVHRPLLNQFWVLTLRYLEMIWHDKRGLILLALQAPIVAIFILLGFGHRPYQEKTLAPRVMTDKEKEVFRFLSKRLHETVEKHEEELAKIDKDGRVKKFDRLIKDLPEMKGPVVPSTTIVNPRFTYMLVFLIVIIIVWFGCNNASKEIVKEEAIYARERAVNLGITPYLASKFLVLSAITALQTFFLMALIYGTMEIMHRAWHFELPQQGLYLLPYGQQFGVLCVLAMTGVAMGLFLSACVNSPDQANVLLPYLLIPQIILGGGIIPIKEGPLHILAALFSPAYWGYRAVHRGVTTMPPDLPWHMDYNDSVLLACAALAMQMILLLGLTAFFLKMKDVQKG